MSGVHKYSTISFRVSPREREEIEARILASGLSKKDYFVRSCIYNQVCVVGKKEVIYQLVEEVKDMQTNIQEVTEQFEQSEVILSEEGMQDMKNDCLDMLKAILWMLDGARYLWEDKRIERTRERKERLEDEIDELFAASEELHSDTEALKETRNQLLSDNEELEKQQKKLQREVDKMVESKEVMERNIHAYDEELRWQLPEPGALMSAKAYRDKKALPLLEKLKELVKNLTIKSVQLAETVKRLTDRVDTLESQVSYLREKTRDQRDRIEELEEKETNFEYLKDYLGKSEVEGIVEYARSKEQADREKERYYGRGR